MTEAVDHIKQNLAQAESITGRKAKVARFEYNILRERGVLLKVHVTGAAKFRITGKHGDAGIADEIAASRRSKVKGKSKRKEVLEAGRRLLIPGHLIAAQHSWEARARYCPKKFGIKDFMADDVSDYYYISFGQWAEFTEKWNEITSGFYAWRQANILDCYDELVKWCRKSSTESANESWDAIVARRNLRLGQPVLVDGKSYTTRERFVKAFVDDTLSRFPSRQEIEEGCRITYHIAVLATTADLDVEKARQDSAKAEQAEYATRQKNAETEAWQRAEAAKAEIEAMQAAKRAAADAQLEAARPLARFVEALNEKMLSYVMQFKESIGDGFVPGKTAEFGRNLINVYRRYSAGIVDEKTEALLNDLTAKIGTVAKTRKIEDIDAAVAALEVELQRNIAQVLDEEPSRFSFLELD